MYLAVQQNRHIIKDTLTQSSYITSVYSRPPHSSRNSPNPTDRDHGTYQHVVTYFDETIIKQLYLNIDDVALVFNQ